MNDSQSIPNGRKLTEQTSIFTPEQEYGNGVFFYENCGNILTIAGYDKEKKAAYVEYANGERKYAE